MTTSRRTPAGYVRQSPPVGCCEPCGKKIYLNRKAARQAAKRLHAEDPPRPYRCLYHDAWWHLGHLPGVVLDGEVSRDEYRDHLPGGAR